MSRIYGVILKARSADDVMSCHDVSSITPTSSTKAKQGEGRQRSTDEGMVHLARRTYWISALMINGNWISASPCSCTTLFNLYHQNQSLWSDI